MIRLVLLLFVFMVTPSLAQTPIPEPERVERTPEDVAAIRLLDAELPRTQQREEVSHFEIPLTIKVGLTPYLHCSDWLNAGRRVTEVIEMDFKEYVKNVLPNEWISTWHPEALKAGAMAVKSFAWWRITLLNPRPMGADVVNNTCDQVFRPNSRKASTDVAVDATWHYRMSRVNRIVEIHYLSTDAYCAQLFPTLLCMGQWGSQDKAVLGWTWEQITHFYYPQMDISVTNTIPPNVQIVANSQFQTDAIWQIAGSIRGYGVVNGVYQFYRRLNATTAASLYQDLNYRVPQASTLALNVLIGNSSALPKTISLHVRNPSTWTGALSCVFTLPPNVPLQPYTMWATTPTSWTGLRLEIIGESADGTPNYLIDRVRLSYVPTGQPADQAACLVPPPGVPTILTPLANSVQGKPTVIELAPGGSNLRPNYNPAYHAQVSPYPDFSQLVYDNGTSLSTTPQLSFIPPSNGVYYVRARQFDGIDRYSVWSASVLFNVVILPGTPVLISPIDTVNAANTFTWEASSDTLRYIVNVVNLNGELMGRAVLLAADCPTSSCSVTIPTFTPAAGVRYNWQVTARNASGRTKSPRSTFTYQTP